MKRWIIVIIVLVVIALIVLCSVSSSKKKAYEVETKKVERTDITQVVSADGKVVPKKEVKISARIYGEIKSIPVEEGDRVKKGDILVVLDKTLFASAHEQAKAAVGTAKANLELARANHKQATNTFERTKQLFDKGLVSDFELETSETAFEVASAQLEAAKRAVEQAQAALNAAKDELDKTELRSPMDGVVIQILKKAGEIALGSQFTEDVILKVADVSAMHVSSEVDETEIVWVKVGQTAKIKVDALPNDEFVGKVVEIAHSAKVKQQLTTTTEEGADYEVKIEIQSGKVELLRPDMSATADIETETHTGVLAIPIGCLTARSDEKTGELKEVVFLFDNGTAKKIEVKSSISSDIMVEISSDAIKEGNEVICAPFDLVNQKLEDKDEVKLKQKRKPEKAAGSGK